MSNINLAAATWDTIDLHKVRSVAWSSLDYISRQVNREFAGLENPVNFVHRQLLASMNKRSLKSQHGAALVCGDMNAERAYFEEGKKIRFAEIDGFDISVGSLRQYHPKPGIKFNGKKTDCNYLQLRQSQYSLAVACHGAHHVYNLGNFFYQANKSLLDGGLMYIYEWIGPNRLQIPFTNHLVSSLLLWLLFSRAQRTTHMGHIKGRWVQSSPDSWEPSEACNSVELWPQFIKYFEPVSVVGHAGLCYPIFEGIAQNLNQEDPLTLLKIKLVYRLEKILTKLKIIQPLFVVAVGKKRPGVF